MASSYNPSGWLVKPGCGPLDFEARAFVLDLTGGAVTQMPNVRALSPDLRT